MTGQTDSISYVQEDPQQLISVLGTETHTWVYGDPLGTPVVLVHGFRGDHHGLEGLAIALAEALPSLAIFVPDLPGFGASPAIPRRTHSLELYGEWLREFTDAIAPTGAAILGHSFGSLIVSAGLSHGAHSHVTILINAISAPALEGPKALLTKLAVGYYRAADAIPEKAARALLGNPLIVRGMSEVMAKTRNPQLRRWIHDQHHQYFSVFDSPETLLDAFRASVSHTVSEFADAFTMPTLLIAGERDDITPLPRQLDLHRLIQNSEFRILPATGHLVHYEAVTEAVGYIRDFLVTQSDASRAADTASDIAGEERA